MTLQKTDISTHQLLHQNVSNWCRFLWIELQEDEIRHIYYQLGIWWSRDTPICWSRLQQYVSLVWGVRFHNWALREQNQRWIKGESHRYVSTRPIPDDSDDISLVPKHQRSSKWVCKKHVVHRWCFLMILWDTWSNCHFNKLFHKSFFFITNPLAKNDSSVLAFVYLCVHAVQTEI
jgi:hypothetical protein